MKVPFHTNCREHWGCHPSCPVAALARHARDLENQIATQKNTKKLHKIIEAAQAVADHFPCSCWINQPQCPACQLREALQND
jgi:hypothetical protein